MLSDRAVQLGIALPGLVAMALLAIVGWRRWACALPVVLALAFMSGYWLLRRPELPPMDGSDWLFWMTAPLTLGGIAFGWLGPKTAAIGAFAGAVVYVVLRPISPAIGAEAIVRASASAALWGTVAAIALPWAARRIGSVWIVAGLASVMAAAAVLVLSSNYLAYGIHGLGAATALAVIAPRQAWMARGSGDHSVADVRGLTVVFSGLLAGLLAGGRYYPNTGVSPIHFHALQMAPLLIPLASMLPGKSRAGRGVLAVVLASALAWSIAIPAARAAKREIETPVGRL